MEYLYDGIILTFETILLIVFVGNSLNNNDCSRRILFIIILAALQVMQRNLLEIFGVWSIFLSLFLDICVVCFGLKGKSAKKVFIILVFYSFSILFDASAGLLSSFLFKIECLSNLPDEYMLFTTTLISKLALLFFVILMKNDFRLQGRFSDWLKKFAVPLFTIAALIIGSPFTPVVTADGTIGLLATICVSIFISNISLIILVRKSYEKEQLEYRLIIYEESKRQHKEHLLELRQAYDQIKLSAHDFKQHLNYIRAVNDLNSIHSYVDKLSGISFSPTLNYTDNFDIDIILHAKTNEISNKGIALEVEGTLPYIVDWLEAVDISIILGNSLSNAIEACERCNGKYISITFRYGGDWLLIEIENPSSRLTPQKKDGFGFISSKSSGNHGIGMESIAASADRYDGMIDFSYIDGKFRLDILLQKNQ